MKSQPEIRFGVESADKIASVLSGQAALYAEELVDGPALNLFDQTPLASQISHCASMLRPADLMLKALEGAELGSKLSLAVDRLKLSMLAVAGRAVMHDRPLQIISEGHAKSVVTGMTGFPDNNKPLSEAMIADMLGQQSRNSCIWEPTRDVVTALYEYGGDNLAAQFIERLHSIGDDNDLACVVSRFRAELMACFLDDNDQAAGALCYELAIQDNKIMGSSLDMGKDEYLAFAAREHTRCQQSEPGMR